MAVQLHPKQRRPSRQKPQQPDRRRSSQFSPDVLLGAHVAPLQFTVLPLASSFHPVSLAARLVAEHGSWNRASRAGYQGHSLPFKDGQPSRRSRSIHDPVLVPDPRSDLVYGRPVGVTTVPDGSLLVADDG